MVKIRLKRLGRKSRPFYRVVVTDNRNRRDGVPMLELGYYNPLTKELKLDKVNALAWIAKGALPSDTAKRLIELAPETGEMIVLPKAERKPSAKAIAAAKKAEEAGPAA
ncbi:MAG: 30S ribosomal protein S16 [Cyanobacteria bacterium]|jgi:small subunit ribosomal protein S16|nr:30S ribosomal protein S16 [Cyanobacteriota bacterium]